MDFLGGNPAADASRLDPVLAQRFARQQEKLVTGRSDVETVGSVADKGVKLDPVLALRWERQRRKIETGHSDVENINPSQWSVKMDPVLARRLSEQQAKIEACNPKGAGPQAKMEASPLQEIQANDALGISAPTEEKPAPLASHGPPAEPAAPAPADPVLAASVICRALEPALEEARDEEAGPPDDGSPQPSGAGDGPREDASPGAPDARSDAPPEDAQPADVDSLAWLGPARAAARRLSLVREAPPRAQAVAESSARLSPRGPRAMPQRRPLDAGAARRPAAPETAPGSPVPGARCAAGPATSRVVGQQGAGIRAARERQRAAEIGHMGRTGTSYVPPPAAPAPRVAAVRGVHAARSASPARQRERLPVAAAAAPRTARRAVSPDLACVALPGAAAAPRGAARFAPVSGLAAKRRPSPPPASGRGSPLASGKAEVGRVLAAASAAVVASRVLAATAATRLHSSRSPSPARLRNGSPTTSPAASPELSHRAVRPMSMANLGAAAGAAAGAASPELGHRAVRPQPLEGSSPVGTSSEITLVTARPSARALHELLRSLTLHQVTHRKASTTLVRCLHEGLRFDAEVLTRRGDRGSSVRVRLTEGAPAAFQKLVSAVLDDMRL